MKVLNVLVRWSDSFNRNGHILGSVLGGDITANDRRDILNTFNVTKGKRFFVGQGGCRSAAHNVDSQLVGTQGA
ncbi:hypothetical protein D3C73_1319730 [compost metagenome]